MGGKKRGQVSLEYMMIMSFSLLLLIPVLIIYGTEKDSITNQVRFTQAREIATQIADKAETVYYLGENSLTTLTVYMPYGTDSVVIQDYEVVVKLTRGETVTDVVAVSGVNMTGEISALPGIHHIRLTAMRDYVNVSNV